MNTDISNADEFDETELRLRQDIEEAIEHAADWVNDATLWWDTDYPPRDADYPRTIEALIEKIVIAAKEYKEVG